MKETSAGTAPTLENTRTRPAVELSSSAAFLAFVSPGQPGRTAANSYEVASVPPVAGDNPVNQFDPSGQGVNNPRGGGCAVTAEGTWCTCPNSPTGTTQVATNGDAPSEDQVWERLLADGLDAVQAAGILGNLLVEDPSLSPSQAQLNDSGQPVGPGYGIAQWEDIAVSGYRWQALLQHFNTPDPSLDNEVDFIQYELLNAYTFDCPNSGQVLGYQCDPGRYFINVTGADGGSDPMTVAEDFATRYEGQPSDAPSISQRESEAQDVYANYAVG